MALTRARAAATALDDHDCAVCGTSVPHELVACADGHDDACPDLVCTLCGGVLVIGSAPLLWRRSA